MRRPSVVWMDPPRADLLEPLLPSVRRVASRREFYAALSAPCAAVFVDDARVAETGAVGMTVPVVAITPEPLSTAVGGLLDYPWVAHVVSEAALLAPRMPYQLSVLLWSLSQPGRMPPMSAYLGDSASGRIARVVDASRRRSRLDRIASFFEAERAGERTVALLRDVAEELLTNALYDAPVAAGFLPGPVSRTEPLILTPDRACDIAYGTTADGLHFVGVKDTFGSLTRRRLVEVLARCSNTGQVPIDDSMGGAGLGLWRVFSLATFVALAVVPGQSTEFVVGLQRRGRTIALPTQMVRPYSVHLYFAEDRRQPCLSGVPAAHEGELEQSVTFHVP